MVLSSQTPRAGSSRQYMSSRPRKGINWKWVAGIALVLGIMYLVWADDGDSTNSATGPETAQAGHRQGQVTGGHPGGHPGGQPAQPLIDSPKATRDLPPSKELGVGSTAKTPEPVVDTIRIGDVQSKADSTPPPQAYVEKQVTPDPPAYAGPTSAQAGSRLSRGMSMIREGRLVQGRRELSQLLFAENANLSPLDAQTVRDTLASVNKHLVFSDEVIPGDPIAESYLVQSGDYLSRIAPKYRVPYQFLELINRTPAERLQAGKHIKVIKGPFHARISKGNYRMDIFVNDPDGQPLYIRSFTVGLGKTDSTPMGAFIVASNSKVKNPSWRNPRTGEFFDKDDPKNPIGEYWLALKGTDANTESASGYGIHGTIDPTSIGRQASMGCVRMSDDDVELIYNMLEGGQSTVLITW